MAESSGAIRLRRGKARRRADLAARRFVCGLCAALFAAPASAAAAHGAGDRFPPGAVVCSLNSPVINPGVFSKINNPAPNAIGDLGVGGQSFSVYAAVPPQAAKPAGIYQDSVIVEVKILDPGGL